MRDIYALQHCEPEFLGLVEDHLEGRGIRFVYVRPFTAGGKVPGTAAQSDGLILTGGGAWGTVSEPILPSLAAELRLTRDFLKRGKPVIGWGIGAQILALAGGGSSVPHPLTACVETVHRVDAQALSGHLPERFPLGVFMRDRPVPPTAAQVLARDARGNPAVFQLGANAVAFTGHPGLKPGMAEDLIMAFDDALVGSDGAPVEPTAFLDAVRAASPAITDALVPMMTGLVELTGWMSPASEQERKRRTIIPIQR
jgi:GMP synthase-like glutamine amidotransferase